MTTPDLTQAVKRLLAALDEGRAAMGDVSPFRHEAARQEFERAEAALREMVK